MIPWTNRSVRRENGFTLIEVLIALAILSIALSAVIKTASQSIQQTTYLQQKIIAAWVGTEVMNEIRAHVLNLKDNDLEEERTALGLTLKIKAEIVSTPNPNIKKIKVDVMKSSRSLQQLTGYLYNETA